MTEPFDHTAESLVQTPSVVRTPTFFQVWFAKNRPVQLWILLATSTSVALTVHLGEFTPGLLIRWPAMVWTVCAIVISLPIGAWIGGILGAILLPPLFRWREKANGGPFAIGDRVQIIAGKHAGRIGRVYALPQGAPFRVDIGPLAAADFTDVFSGVEVMLVTSPTRVRSTPGNGSPSEVGSGVLPSSNQESPTESTY